MPWVLCLVLMTAGQSRIGPSARPGAAVRRGQAAGATAGHHAPAGEKAGRIDASVLRGVREEVASGPTPGAGPSHRCRRPCPHQGRDGQAQKRVPPSPGGSPGDRYSTDGAVDWSEVPPWRQTSFFGIRARGQFFVYVVDCSGSMIDDDRMPRATIELRRSVFGLREPQRFEVIFYNSESIPMPGGPIRARPTSNRKTSCGRSSA